MSTQYVIKRSLDYQKLAMVLKVLHLIFIGSDRLGQRHSALQSLASDRLQYWLIKWWVLIKFHSYDRLDTRANKEIGKPTAVHKKGTKVVGLHCHPVEPDLFLTCGNDHMVCYLLTMMLSSMQFLFVRF